MPRGFCQFVKGMGIGVMAGCVAGVIANQYMHSHKKGLKRNLGKALKNMSEIVEEVGDIF